MKINIKTTNLDLSDPIYAYVEEKIGALDKYIANIEGSQAREFQGKSLYEAWVEIGRTSYHHQKGDVYRAEVQIRLPGKSIRAESENWDLRLAIDEVRDELQRQLKRYTQKQSTEYKKGARTTKGLLRLHSLLERFKE